ncbi:MAG: PilN domain-containing protein [Proteobacteria bacterium]|nr:PilN domain-containing protein [Pseudomonadota bacterium]
MPAVDPGTVNDPLGSTPVANALRWWLDELTALGADVAATLRIAASSALVVELGARGGWSLVRETRSGRAVLGTVDAERLDDEAVRRTLRRLLGHGKPEAIAVLLPATAVLTRAIRLPVAAARDLPSILEFEIARHTPFTAERAYYRHRLLGRATAAGTIEVELRVAPRELIDTTLRRLAAVGLSTTTVTAVDTPPRDRPRASLMPTETRPAVIWTLGNRIRVGVAAGALVAALLAPIAVAHLRLAGIARDIGALRPTVERRLTEQERDLRQRTALDAVVAIKRAAPATVELLGALTHALPDGSWLTSLQLTGRDLVIEGYAPAAAALVRPLELAGPFAQVGYRAPITRDPQSAREHFQFDMRLAEPAP